MGGPTSSDIDVQPQDDGFNVEDGLSQGELDTMNNAAEAYNSIKRLNERAIEGADGSTPAQPPADNFNVEDGLSQDELDTINNAAGAYNAIRDQNAQAIEGMDDGGWSNEGNIFQGPEMRTPFSGAASGANIPEVPVVPDVAVKPGATTNFDTNGLGGK